MQVGLDRSLGPTQHHRHFLDPEASVIVQQERAAQPRRQALDQGAQDYLVKGTIDSNSLWRAMQYAARRQRTQLDLLSVALTDDLTGLNNRRGFIALAEHHAQLAYRTGKPFLIAFVDLDGMKQINDTFGHQEGNRALMDAADLLRDSIRHSDVLGRLGGDEFAALVIDAVEERAETLALRLQQKLNTHNANPGRLYDLSLSFGIVPWTKVDERPDIEHLLAQADELMYKQKTAKGASRSNSAKQSQAKS